VKEPRRPSAWSPLPRSRAKPAWFRKTTCFGRHRSAGRGKAL